jgi:hypothetical protein
MDAQGGVSKYAISLAALERSARVPLAEQRTGQAEVPPEDAISQYERERAFLFSVAGAG